MAGSDAVAHAALLQLPLEVTLCRIKALWQIMWTAVEWNPRAYVCHFVGMDDSPDHGHLNGKHLGNVPALTRVLRTCCTAHKHLRHSLTDDLSRHGLQPATVHSPSQWRRAAAGWQGPLHRGGLAACITRPPGQGEEWLKAESGEDLFVDFSQVPYPQLAP